MGKCNRVADYTGQSQTDRGSLCNEKLVVAITPARAYARAREWLCAGMRLYVKEHVFARPLPMRFSAKRLAATLPPCARYRREAVGCSYVASPNASVELRPVPKHGRTLGAPR